MPKREPLGETGLKALVAREIANARSDREAASRKLTRALEYYQGEMKDIPAEEGRSSVVSRDLADTMGWMQPSLMRVFCASDRMALCEPVGDEDEAFARQATDGINHIFWKENDGYRVLYDGTWDSLIGGNGVIKVWWDDTPKDVVSYHSGLSDDALAELFGDDGGNIEVLAHSAEVEAIEDPETGEQIPMQVHAVKIRRRTKGGKTSVEAIPPEDYGIDGDAKTSRDARFQYHRCQKTRSDLIEMGFDRKTVETLGKASDNTTSEEIARQERMRGDDGDASMDLVDLYECYIKADVDGDGVAEMCRVYYAGNSGGGEILDWEVWEDEAPFHDIPCEPMPHRWQARSIFDETEDVQQVKTVMLRQANDNTYATNNPQRFVKGKISNPEELFSPNFGGAVFGDVNSSVENLSIAFVANHAYDALNYQDQVIQRRTGVSRQTMALDPEALSNQSATANQNEKDASYSQIELVARNMAEFGWVNVFKAILRIEVKHQDTERTIRLSGKPVRIDPKWWNTDMDVTINVGLGTGSRDRDAQMLSAVMGQQLGLAERYMAAGAMDKAIELLPYIHTAQLKFAEAVGLRNPEAFFPEVDERTVEALKAGAAEQAKQPDPALALEQMKGQASMQIEAGKAQLAQQQAVLDSEAAVRREQAQLEADMRTKEADRQNAIVLEQQRQAFEREKLASQERIAFARIEADMILEREKLANAQLVAAMQPQPKPNGSGQAA